MKEDIKIGIVIPVFNEVDNLKLLLKSFNTEGNSAYISRIMIIAGDRDIKKYAPLVTEYLQLSGKIFIIANPKKITPVALNLGIKKCLTEGINIIQFLGAHSIVNDNFFINLHKHVYENPQIDIFNASLRFTEPLTSKERAIQLFTYSRLGRNWRGFFAGIKEGFTTGIFAVRAEVFNKTGLFNEEFVKNQDIEFVKRALRNGNKALLFTDLIYFYKVRSSISGTLSQMFTTGRYISLDFSSAGFKHLAPFAFYSFILLMLIIYLLSGINIIVYFLYGIILFYILVNFIESVRFLIKKEISALLLPVLFISSHLFYAGGTFYGLYYRIIKK